MTWLPARPRRSSTAIPPPFKARWKRRPRNVKRKPKKPRFNYIIDLGIKWHRSSLYFIATYACPGPTAISPTFESKFARMEFVGNQPFNVSFMRHTGKWVEIYSRQTLDECLETVRDDYWFQLG
jgi:hypothetical protein